MQREGLEAQIVYLRHPNSMGLGPWRWVNTPIELTYLFTITNHTIPVRLTKQEEFNMIEAVKTLLHKYTGYLAGWLVLSPSPQFQLKIFSPRR